MQFNPLTGEIYDEPNEVSIYPAKHYLTDADRLKDAITDIEAELDERLAYFKENGKLPGSPAHRAAHPLRPGDAARRSATAPASRTTRATWTGARPARLPGR